MQVYCTVSLGHRIILLIDGSVSLSDSQSAVYKGKVVNESMHTFVYRSRWILVFRYNVYINT